MVEKLTFIPLNETLKEDFLNLEVHPSQIHFIESPAISLEHMETNAWNIPWTIQCIFDENQMIGYTMYGQNKEKDIWLDRFMIDKNFQGKGYGKLALSQIINMLKEEFPNRRNILLSVEPENVNAIKLYEKFGFKMANYIEDNEEVMILSK